MENISNIPLINDLLTTYNNVDIKNYFDDNILKIHNEILENSDNIEKSNKQYTNQEIYDYIKFINFSGLDNDCYKRISKYINVDNFEFFYPLFDNNDIVHELFQHLQYDVVKNHPKFNLELWIYNNIKWVTRYNSKLLEPFMIYNTKMFYNKINKYYMINNNIYSFNKRDINHDKSDLSEFIKNDLIKLFKHLIEKLYKLKDKNIVDYLKDNIGLAFNYGRLDILKYLFEFIKSNNEEFNINIDEIVEIIIYYLDFKNNESSYIDIINYLIDKIEENKEKLSEKISFRQDTLSNIFKKLVEKRNTYHV